MDRELRTSLDARAKILLVDDTLANLVALQALLEPLGQELVMARSGEEALRRLLAEEFAVVLLDVRMPGMDGFEAATLIRARSRTRTVPIIFLTASIQASQQVFRGYASGAVDFLVKPFEPDILRAKVAIFVDLHLAREQVRHQADQLREKDRQAFERTTAVRYQNLMDVMPHCVWATRADGGLYLVNERWRSYSGLDLEETRALTVFHVAHPSDRVHAESAWASAMRSGHPVEFECRFRSAQDGSYRSFLVRGVPDRTAEADIVGWIGTATDVDENIRARDALRTANEAKDAFLAAASHELRTPLAAAKAQAQLAIRRLSESIDAKSVDMLRRMEGQIDRLAKLVADMLDVSRLQAGRISMEPIGFDLVACLRDACERLQAVSYLHTIELHAPDQVMVSADRGRIEQVITNLLSNSIRYAPDGGPIEVRVVRGEEKVTFSVRDHGLGVPPEDQRAIFEKFVQAGARKNSGLGLGLAIAQGIVKEHGGRIWLESTGEPGGGCTFFVELPLAPPSPPRAGSGSGVETRISLVPPTKVTATALANGTT